MYEPFYALILNGILFHSYVVDCIHHYIIVGKLLDAQVAIENVKNKLKIDKDINSKIIICNHARPQVC